MLLIPLARESWIAVLIIDLVLYLLLFYWLTIKILSLLISSCFYLEVFERTWLLQGKNGNGLVGLESRM
ncbi:Hypothetical protein PMT_2792 [Prochlorococcus marinus str. MIT 9313]|uniref:Uncharacterized protein n=1 Tax=Prochlorococcus marinus (strain MIT 9313) TaxID=74547 RepID=B9ESG5_PROMM|nr:Hypothetical protein PMT_2792 [Prochlorococcus marinus str. MIT 9313]